MDPFAPISGPSSPTANATPCPRCGRPMDPQTASYDDRGQLVCRACMSQSTVSEANATIELRDPGSTRNLYGGAIFALLAGVGTCVISGLGSFFFLLAPAAVASGIWILAHLVRTPETKQQLGGGYWLVMLASLTGILFGLLAMGIGVLALIATH